MSVKLATVQLLDDCWASTERDANGNIQPDPTRFPNGIPSLADYIHSKGLIFGLYTCAGDRTCKFNRTGSGGHEAADAQTFANWNIDYVKEDNCGHPNEDPLVYYGNMSHALNATGHPMWFATCNWGEVCRGLFFGSGEKIHLSANLRLHLTENEVPFAAGLSLALGRLVGSILSSWA